LRPLSCIAVAISLSATLAFPAYAAKFDFGDLEWRHNANAGFLPTAGAHSCTGGDLCSSDVDHGKLGGSLVYTDGFLTATATGWYDGKQVAAMQDHDNNHPTNEAGLGVYHESRNNSDDNVTKGESLILTFSKPVELSEIGLRADGHNTTGWTSGATFLFSVDGGAFEPMLLPKGTGEIDSLDIVGSTFTFAYGGNKADQFYLSDLTVTAVPEPMVTALMLTGLGLFAARRRDWRSL
jgi:hypothetical protein